jgi:multidrug efflux pump subunit AcrA (membrane-fusion protein)
LTLKKTNNSKNKEMTMCKFKMTILAGSCALLTVPMPAEECGKEPIARAAIGEHAGTEADRGTNGAARIPVTRDQVSRFGIMIAPATTGTVTRSMKASGEIRVDPDRVAHVVPLAQGIVRQVVKTVGDTVQTGEILAWIESAELAEAKLDFYARESESARSGLRLPQTRAIYENTSRLSRF